MYVLFVFCFLYVPVCPAPYQTFCSIAISYATHARHNTENIVVGSIDTDLSSGSTLNSGVGENKLECRVINAGEVACAGRLVLLRA